MIDNMFTDEEKYRAAILASKAWNELNDIAKLSFGMTARTYFTPENIVNTILYGEDRTKWPE